MIFVETSAKDNTGVEQVTELILKITFFWSAGFPGAGWQSASKSRHLEPRTRTRHGCSNTSSASYPRVSHDCHHICGSSSFNPQASTKKNIKSAALLWNLDGSILAVFLYFCILHRIKWYTSPKDYFARCKLTANVPVMINIELSFAFDICAYKMLITSQFHLFVWVALCFILDKPTFPIFLADLTGCPSDKM